MKKNHFGTCFQDTVNFAETLAKGTRPRGRVFISCLFVVLPIVVLGGTALFAISHGYSGLQMGFGPSGAFLDLRKDSSDRKVCLQADSKVQ